MRCVVVRESLALLEVDVDDVELVDDALEDVELDESEELLMSGGGPGGGPPVAEVPFASSDGAVFCRNDDSSDSETLPLPSVSMDVNKSSSDEALLLDDVPLLDDALLDAAWLAFSSSLFEMEPSPSVSKSLSIFLAIISLIFWRISV